MPVINNIGLVMCLVVLDRVGRKEGMYVCMRDVGDWKGRVEGKGRH